MKKSGQTPISSGKYYENVPLTTLTQKYAAYV